MGFCKPSLNLNQFYKKYEFIKNQVKNQRSSNFITTLFQPVSGGDKLQDKKESERRNHDKKGEV